MGRTVLVSLHDDHSMLPEIPPAHTPAPAEHHTTFYALELHKNFGCRQINNQAYIFSASKIVTLIKDISPTLGYYTTINNPNNGKPLTKYRKFSDKVHLDIV